MEKMCIRCRMVKDVINFTRKRANSYQSYCKPCQTERVREWRAKNPDQNTATQRAWLDKNREHHNEWVRQWRINNPERNKELARRATSKESHKENIKAWEKAHPGNACERTKRWQKNNLHKVNAAGAKRRAGKLNATPSWADLEAIKDIYRQARSLKKETGLNWHVDHIVPLQSKIVSGLHVEHNLQIILAADNIKKSNRYWPHMPEITA